MKIKRIEISSYGKLREISLDFSDRLNIIEGANESGKSTLMSFIAYMLYGADQGDAAYIKASNGVSSGKMIISSGSDGDFSIERHTSLNGKRIIDGFKIISLDTLGEVKTLKSPGEYFLGVGRDFFKNSAYVSQSGASGFSPSETSVQIQNILISGSEKMNPNQGRKRLDELRKKYALKRGSGGYINDIEDRLSSLKDELYEAENAKKELLESEGQLSDCEAERLRQYKLREALTNEINARTAAKAEELGRELTKSKETLKRRKFEALDYQRECRKYEEMKISERLGEIPTSLGIASSRLSFAVAERDRLSEELSEYERVEAIPEDAIEKLISSVEKKRASANQKKSISAFFLVIGLLMLALGVATAIGFSIPVGIAFVTAALVAAIFAFFILSRRKLILSEIEAELKVFKLLSDSSSQAIRAELMLRNKVNSEIDSKIEFIARKDAEILEEREKIKKINEEIRSISKALNVDASEDDLLCSVKSCEDFIEKLYDDLRSSERECELLEGSILGLRKRLGEYQNIPQSLPLNPTFSKYSDFELDAFMKKTIEMIDELSEKIEAYKVKISSEMSVVKPVSEINAEIERLSGELAERKRQLEIIYLADDLIGKASEDIRLSVTPNLIRKSSEILSLISDGKYTRVGLDDSLRLNGIYSDEEGSKAVLSYGTNEVVYLSLRIALCRVLSVEGNPPILLDESLAHIDNIRTREILAMLSESGAQAFLFTCTDRESRVASESGIPVCSIRI